jgi:lipopolysaccharide assembly outer membrane protein LptD (OstA)
MSSLTEASTRRRGVAPSHIVGGLALLGVVALMGTFIWQAGVLAPPRPQDVTAVDVIEKPEQITSTNASIAGREHLVHMNEVTSVFERPSGAKLDVSSQTGQYDRKTKALELSGDVVFSEGTRFKAVMEKAAIDTNTQMLTSRSPVKVDMQGTMIEADSLTVTENGTRILFKGGVRARFENKKKTGDGG